MEGAAKIVAELGFDGLDINTGCPDKTVEKQGCGSALIKNPELFKELYAAAVRGVSGKTLPTSSRENSLAEQSEENRGLFREKLVGGVDVTQMQPIPVSVKCRIGYYKPEIDTWLRTILEQKPAALVVHLRTREEMSKVPAHWELMPEIVALRNEVSPSTVLVGNGDIHNVEHGKRMVTETGCDGVMIGRGMFGNPWYGTMHVATKEERIAALIEHIEEFEKQLAGIKSFAVMKKHFSSYMSHFDGAHEIRLRLMETNSADDAVAVLHSTI
jgi:tRNA-dihydrouridine synthase